MFVFLTFFDFIKMYYINKKIVGSHLVKERIEYFDRIPNKSTTQILSYEDISNRGNVC